MLKGALGGFPPGIDLILRFDRFRGLTLTDTDRRQTHHMDHLTSNLTFKQGFQASFFVNGFVQMASYHILSHFLVDFI